jgi:uncharacterized protein YbjT (DUF2867 family)
MKRVLLAGATGYLGRCIAKELCAQNYLTKVLVRNPAKFKSLNIQVNEITDAEVTDKPTLRNSCQNVDVVISTIGITKQKDGLNYMDVDYQANLNLLEEAQKSAVKKFIYVSVLNGDKLKHTKICEAKEKFVDQLKKSGLNYCIIRPNGFFSDMSEFLKMANKGKVYLFGDGNQKSNPIHGEDLAKICVDAIDISENEIKVGGPEVLTHNQIAEIALDAAGKNHKVVHVPDWIRRLLLKIGKLTMNSKNFGPVEFFMNVMAIDMVAPKYGTHKLKNYFNSLNKN